MSRVISGHFEQGKCHAAADHTEAKLRFVSKKFDLILKVNKQVIFLQNVNKQLMFF